MKHFRVFDLFIISIWLWMLALYPVVYGLRP